MRTMEYVSPSGLRSFESNREEFYLRYLADCRPPRPKQTAPMAMGSAFDAFVKSYLHFALFANYGKDDTYDPDVIFESQVDADHRSEVHDKAQHLFMLYRKCGALTDLMIELEKAAGEPRFEFEIRSYLDAGPHSIPILGKPDLFYINKFGAHVILDWKVNGYYSKSRISPTKGYTKIRDTWGPLDAPAARGHMLSHRNAILIEHRGVTINATYMNDCSSEWADQLCIYAWLLGAEVGSENLIVGIEQIVCNDQVRVASHRSRVAHDYQLRLRSRYQYLWDCVTSGHFFDDTSISESRRMCAGLEQKAEALASDDDFSRFVNQQARGY